MARPKPTILMEHVDSDTYRSEQVLAADAIYAVFFDGQPINLRTLNKYFSSSNTSPNYKKVSFSNQAHCVNLASRLNEMFKTDKFEAMKLTQGEVISSNEKSSGSNK